MKLSEVLRKAEAPKEMPPMPKTNRSRFQLILDNLYVAHKNMHNAAMLLVNLAKDIEAEMEHINFFRQDLIHTIEGDGGEINPLDDVAKEIAAYIPKGRSLDGQDQKVQTRPENSLPGPTERE